MVGRTSRLNNGGMTINPETISKAGQIAVIVFILKLFGIIALSWWESYLAMIVLALFIFL